MRVSGAPVRDLRLLGLVYDSQHVCFLRIFFQNMVICMGAEKKIFLSQFCSNHARSTGKGR